MGSDPILWLHVPFVEWFDKWKTTLPKANFVRAHIKKINYLLGEGRKRA